VVPSEPKEAEGERDHSSAALASVRLPISYCSDVVLCSFHCFRSKIIPQRIYQEANVYLLQLAKARVTAQQIEELNEDLKDGNMR
jgi:hypothetical protein